jgi:hypothetical protein
MSSESSGMHTARFSILYKVWRVSLGLILLYHSKWGSKMIISDLVIFQLLPLFWDSLLTYENQQ